MYEASGQESEILFFSLLALHPSSAAAAVDYGDNENGNVASPKDFCQRYVVKVLADP